MSIRWMNRVWDHSKQGGSALLLMIALADQANDQGICWPSVGTLARKTRMSERTVQDLIHGTAERPEHPARPGLVDSGELEVLQGGGRNRTSTYRLTVRESHPSENEPVESNRGNGAESAPFSANSAERVQRDTEKGAACAEKGASRAERVQRDTEKVQRAAPEPSLTVIGTVTRTVKEPSRARARGLISKDDDLRICEECDERLPPEQPIGLRVCVPCAKGARARASTS